MSRMSISSTAPFFIHIFVTFPLHPLYSFDLIFPTPFSLFLSLFITLLFYRSYTISHSSSPNDRIPSFGYLIFLFTVPTMYPSIYVIYLSIYLSIYPSMYRSIDLSIYLSTYLCNLSIFLYLTTPCSVLFRSVLFCAILLFSQLLLQSSINTWE